MGSAAGGRKRRAAERSFGGRGRGRWRGRSCAERQRASRRRARAARRGGSVQRRCSPLRRRGAARPTGAVRRTPRWWRWRDSLLRSRQEMRAPVKGACNAGAERRLAARPSEQAAAQASRGAGRWRRRMPLEAAGELRRGSRASGGEADGARCLAQRPRRAGSPGAGRWKRRMPLEATRELRRGGRALEAKPKRAPTGATAGATSRPCSRVNVPDRRRTRLSGCQHA